MTDHILEPKQNPLIVGLAYGIWFLTAFLSVLVFTAGYEIAGGY